MIYNPSFIYVFFLSNRKAEIALGKQLETLEKCFPSLGYDIIRTPHEIPRETQRFHNNCNIVWNHSYLWRVSV